MEISAKPKYVIIFCPENCPLCPFPHQIPPFSISWHTHTEDEVNSQLSVCTGTDTLDVEQEYPIPLSYITSKNMSTETEHWTGNTRHRKGGVSTEATAGIPKGSLMYRSRVVPSFTTWCSQI